MFFKIPFVFFINSIPLYPCLPSIDNKASHRKPYIMYSRLISLSVKFNLNFSNSITELILDVIDFNILIQLSSY